jgi:plastocyanin
MRSFSVPLLFALCALLCALTPAAGVPQSGQAPLPAGGTIRGRVEVRRPAPAMERRPNVADLGAQPSRVPDRQDLLRSVVYLESAPAAAFADEESQHAIMDQRDETFFPHVLAITAGTTVDFPNSDKTYHNVFSISKAKSFDLGRYASGRSKAVRFDRPGIVRVFCEIHSHMSAFILVFSHRYFAVTGPDGRYQIPRVPPGGYTLDVWNEGAVRESRQITVPESGVDGTAVDADFTLR